MSKSFKNGISTCCKVPVNEVKSPYIPDLVRSKSRKDKNLHF